MILSEKDCDQFIRLHNFLVYFAYKIQRKEEIRYPESGKDSWRDFLEDDEQFQAERLHARNFLYDSPDLIGRFLQENPFRLSREDLDIVGSWKHFVKDNFFVSRHLKKYSVFLAANDEPKAYGVLGISDEIEDLLGSRTPWYVEAVLLPFKDWIVYDGLLGISNITFGGGFRRSIDDSYMKAKTRYGIITSLPLEEEHEGEEDHLAMLRFYLKSERNREYYEEEIHELLDNHPSLAVPYHQEMGKVHARRYKRILRDIGFSNAWFGILDGCIVGSGRTRDDLMMNLKPILPPKMAEFMYVFRVK